MKFELAKALIIAEKIKAELKPFCERIEIAGSIRRKKEFVKDIEIVCIAKPFDVGLFESGVAIVINKWEKVKGELPGKYTQRILPEGIKLDLFFATKENWGLIYAIRTGSAEFSHRTLAVNWVKKGYKGIEGFLHKNDKKINIYEEKDLFDLLEMDFIEPKNRNFKYENKKN